MLPLKHRRPSASRCHSPSGPHLLLLSRRCSTYRSPLGALETGYCWHWHWHDSRSPTPCQRQKPPHRLQGHRLQHGSFHRPLGVQCVQRAATREVLDDASFTPRQTPFILVTDRQGPRDQGFCTCTREPRCEPAAVPATLSTLSTTLARQTSSPPSIPMRHCPDLPLYILTCPALRRFRTRLTSSP